MAATWNDSIDQGADVRRVLWYEDPSGVYLDLTGYTFEAELRTSPKIGSETLVASLVCTIIDNPEANAENPVLTNRALELSLTDEQTAAITDGLYTFELWSVSPSGVRECDFAGNWKLNARGVR